MTAACAAHLWLRETLTSDPPQYQERCKHCGVVRRRTAPVVRSGCIHRVRDTFSVSSADGMWLPGIYADEAACRKALEVAEVDYLGLAELARWEVRGQGDDYRPITVEDLATVEAQPHSPTV